MTTASQFSSGFRAKVATLALCFGAAFLLPPAFAQERLQIDELTLRSAAGDKGATRALEEAYYLGRGGVEQNFSEAARWYLVLARQGDARAQTSIGLMYARGWGVKQDFAEARRWWNFAAAQNDPAAQFNLGLLYTQEEPRDYARAVSWYRRAASRGHVQAQHNLGMLCFEGKGTDPDPVQAYFWVRVAALQGDEVAEKSLTTIAASMKPDDLAKAEAEANDWIGRAQKKVH
jgi:TPR repeat protein